MRVAKLVRDADKRDLTLDEVEKLRRTEAVLGLMPGYEEMLCNRGQTTISTMRTIIRDAEEKYRDEHPTIVDGLPLDETN